MNSYIEVMMPTELKDVLMSSPTLYRTGNIGHYQGGNAFLEEINKEAKSWISTVGVPMENDWIKEFGNLGFLSEMKQNLLSSVSVLAPEKV